MFFGALNINNYILFFPKTCYYLKIGNNNDGMKLNYVLSSDLDLNYFKERHYWCLFFKCRLKLEFKPFHLQLLIGHDDYE